jgi:type II secretory pathway predicted ATPase ExeA
MEEKATANFDGGCCSMNQTRFGLSKRPFPATPDTSSYYPATGHEQALGKILQALLDGEGMALLVGEAGTGKTLLCHCLLERLQTEMAIAFLTNSHGASRKDLLQAILYDLSLPFESGSEQELRLRLTDYLLTNYAQGKRTLLIVDEAQHLPQDALEELRLLGNLEAGQRKAVQVLLVGQPKVLPALAKPGLESLNQRLAVRTALTRLGLEEAVDYLLHHLRIAGARPEEVFTDEALEMLARSTRGIPRLLNQAAHQTLQLCQQLEAEIADVEVVLETLTSLGLVPVDRTEETGAAPGTEIGADGEVETTDAGVLAYRLFSPRLREGVSR